MTEKLEKIVTTTYESYLHIDGGVDLIKKEVVCSKSCSCFNLASGLSCHNPLCEILVTSKIRKQLKHLQTL
jgi:hypothetical protein